MPRTRTKKVFDLLKSREGEWMDRHDISRLVNETARDVEYPLRVLAKRGHLIRKKQYSPTARMKVWIYTYTADCIDFQGHYSDDVSSVRNSLERLLTQKGQKFKSKADLFKAAGVAYGKGDYALRSWPYLFALAASAVERRCQEVAPPRDRNTSEDVRVKIQCAIAEAEFNEVKFKSLKSFMEYAGVSITGFKSFCYRYPNQRKRIICNLIIGSTETAYDRTEAVSAVKKPPRRLDRVISLLEQAESCQYSTIGELCEVAGISQCYLQRAFHMYPDIRRMAIRACKSMGMSEFVASELAELERTAKGSLTFAQIAASVDISYSQLTYYCQTNADVNLLVNKLKNQSLVECRNPFNLHRPLRLPKNQLFENGLCEHCNAKAEQIKQRHRELDRLQIQSLRKEMERKVS